MFAIRLDVTDHAGFTAVLDEVEREVGPIDILINNAGIMPIGNFEDDSFESAYRQFAINVFAVMHGTREAIKRMKPRGRGHIVNLASMAGVVPTPGAATYCSSKHAVVGLCESLYWELRGTGIDLSYVLPSLVKTELAAGVKDTRASNSIEPEVVAGEIVKALKKPKLAVYAPALDGPDHEGHRPHPARDRQQDHDGVRVGSPAARFAVQRRPAAYEERIAASAPGAEQGPSAAVAGFGAPPSVPVESDDGPSGEDRLTPVGYGVIGSPTDSGSVSLGSSPGTPAQPQVCTPPAVGSF